MHQLTYPEIEQWRRVRFFAGQERYKNSHLLRNGPVDIMEELLDALNIADLAENRMITNGVRSNEITLRLQILRRLLQQAIKATIELDSHMPDSVCTDEAGGDRIWWPGDR